MPSIFNSLGSNYDRHFVRLSLRQLWPWRFRSRKHLEQLRETLQTQFSGDVFLTYKGRDSIELILKHYQISEGDQVLTQALACYAVEEAIIRASARPTYVDLADQSLAPGLEEWETARRQANQPKAVLVQHILGIPTRMKPLAEWCRKHNLLLIEDLAQSYGAADEDGTPLGTYADAIILSFGRDKIIDAVSGGAAILKKKSSNDSVFEIGERVLTRHIVTDMIYPFLTSLIRQTHDWGLGKVLLHLGKLTHVLTSPIISPTHGIISLPAAYASLALYQLSQVNQQLTHRRLISQLYYRQLKSHPEVTILISEEEIKNGANLRFPISVDQPRRLLAHLKKSHVYLSDRWYRAPVDCGSVPCITQYQVNSCQRAETMATHILNLPTHAHITLADAHFITDCINTYQ